MYGTKVLFIRIIRLMKKSVLLYFTTSKVNHNKVKNCKVDLNQVNLS